MDNTLQLMDGRSVPRTEPTIANLEFIEGEVDRVKLGKKYLIGWVTDIRPVGYSLCIESKQFCQHCDRKTTCSARPEREG